MERKQGSAMLITGMMLAAVAVIDGAGGSLSAVPGNCAGNAQRRNGNYCGDFARCTLAGVLRWKGETYCVASSRHHPWSSESLMVVIATASRDKGYLPLAC